MLSFFEVLSLWMHCQINWLLYYFFWNRVKLCVYPLSRLNRIPIDFLLILWMYVSFLVLVILFVRLSNSNLSVYSIMLVGLIRGFLNRSIWYKIIVVVMILLKGWIFSRFTCIIYLANCRRKVIVFLFWWQISIWETHTFTILSM